jgi:hypothetical protein
VQPYALALERTLGLPGEAAAKLRARQAATSAQRHAFSESWEEECADIALERAGAFLDPGVAKAKKPKKSQLFDSDSDDDSDSDEDDSDDDNALPGGDLPAAPGHVRVGGVEVRCRPAESSGRDGPAGVAARGGVNPMVRTRSAKRNLEAVALALCQVGLYTLNPVPTPPPSPPPLVAAAAAAGP